MTASNGPAEVEVSASHACTSKSPAPVDDRGRRRDRVELHGPRSVDSEDEETEALRTSRRHSICRRTRSPGLSPTPSVFLKARAACRRGRRTVTRPPALYRLAATAPIRLRGRLFQTLTHEFSISRAPFAPGLAAIPRHGVYPLVHGRPIRRPRRYNNRCLVSAGCQEEPGRPHVLQRGSVSMARITKTPSQKRAKFKSGCG